MPSKFTVSQLPTRGSTYEILDTDLTILTTGTATYDLSSVRVTTKELGDYMTSKYANTNTFSVHGPLSGAEGLSARHLGSGVTIKLEDVPTSPTNLNTGDVYTQTVTQLGTLLGISVSDSTKVLFIK